MLRNPKAYTDCMMQNLRRYFVNQGFDQREALALAVLTFDDLCDYAGALGLDEEQGTVLAFRIAARKMLELA